MAPAFGVSIQPEAGCAQVLGPMLAEGAVDRIEWTVDTAHNGRRLPGWFVQLLRSFAPHGRLVAHGVGASWMSPAHSPGPWLAQSARLLAALPARHLTEHVGWNVGGQQVFGAPLPPPPRSRTAWELVAQRMNLARQQLGVPVGLEVLALAWSPSDVEWRGPAWGWLVERLPETVLHLDVHNIWCQAATFGLDPIALLERLPLSHVRLAHISGGRWSQPLEDAPPVRRDTHDDGVPEDLWTLLDAALSRCPALDAVFFERIAGTWDDPGGIRADLDRLQGALSRPIAPQLPSPVRSAIDWIDDTPAQLGAWQAAVTRAARTQDPTQLTAALRSGPYQDAFHDLDQRMVHTVLELTRRWSRWSVP